MKKIIIFIFLLFFAISPVSAKHSLSTEIGGTNITGGEIEIIKVYVQRDITDVDVLMYVDVEMGSGNVKVISGNGIFIKKDLENAFFRIEVEFLKVHSDATSLVDFTITEKSVSDNSVVNKDSSSIALFLHPNETAGCVDSDNGISIFKKGKVIKDGKIAEDSCSASDVIEYYCNFKDDVAIKKMKCGNGCTNGACNMSGGQIVSTESKVNTLPVASVKDSVKSSPIPVPTNINNVGRDVKEFTKKVAADKKEQSNPIMFYGAIFLIILGWIVSRYANAAHSGEGGVSLFERNVGRIMFIVGVIMIFINFAISFDKFFVILPIMFYIFIFTKIKSAARNKKFDLNKFVKNAKLAALKNRNYPSKPNYRNRNKSSLTINGRDYNDVK